MLEDMLKYKVKVIALSEDIWEQRKVEYISNRKNGVGYSLKNLPNNNDISLINNKVEATSNFDVSSSSIDRIVNIVGEDIIEYV